MIVSVDALGQYGIITDQHAHKLPSNAWTSGKNVRFENGEVKRVAGYDSLAAFPALARWTLPVQSGNDIYWLICADETIYYWDGTSSIEIGQVYGSDAALWNGGVFGGIAVFNNGIDDPQYWVPSSDPVSTLTNWPTNWKARVIRPYKNLLIAMDMTIDGERYQTQYIWSDVADPGALPDWDLDTPSSSSGSDVLEETQGAIIDGEPLRDYFVVYKEDATFILQFIGGQFVITNRMVLKTRGILTQRCAKEAYGKHYVLSNGDIFVHDGQNAESIADGRIRREVFDNIDPDNYVNSYVAPNFINDEMWFCYPEIGNTYPNKAAIYNWKDKTWGFRDLPNASHIAYGVLPSTESRTIDSLTFSIDSWTDSIDQRLYNPADRKNVMLAPDSEGLTPAADLTPSASLEPSEGSSSLYSVDDGWEFSGTAAECYVERRGLKPEKGDGVFHLRAIYPRGEGGEMTIRVGKQDSPSASVSWASTHTYTPGSTSDKVDTRVTGRYFAIEVRFPESGPGELQGIDFDIVKAGTR